MTARITCEITDEQKRKLDAMLDYGEIKKVLNAIINTLIKAYDQFGKIAIYAVITEEFDLFQFSQLSKKHMDMEELAKTAHEVKEK